MSASAGVARSPSKYATSTDAASSVRVTPSAYSSASAFHSHMLLNCASVSCVIRRVVVPFTTSISNRPRVAWSISKSPVELVVVVARTGVTVPVSQRLIVAALTAVPEPSKTRFAQRVPSAISDSLHQGQNVCAAFLPACLAVESVIGLAGSYRHVVDVVGFRGVLIEKLHLRRGR